MESVNIYIRFSELNSVLNRVGTLNRENNLVYQDGEDCFKSYALTTIKFTLLTAASPLIAVARVIRSLAFACMGEFSRSGRELLGGLATPLMSTSCLIGSLLTPVISILKPEDISFYVQMKRTYGYFEAWINGIDLQDSNLPSYSKRTSHPFDCVGDSTKKGQIYKNVWTVAPCMQPVLEQGMSSRGGLLDAKRMKKIFPLVKINDVSLENGNVVIQSEYLDKNMHYVACNGAYERARLSQTCCCCYRIDAAFDRFLCCQIGQGNCTSMFNSNDSCGISFCTVANVSLCCIHAQGEDLDQFDAACIVS